MKRHPAENQAEKTAFTGMKAGIAGAFRFAENPP